MRTGKTDIGRLLGKRIRELRTEKGWQQVELEARLDEGVTRAALSSYETGRRIPSVRVLGQLAKAFGVSPVALLLDPNASNRDRAAIEVLDCEESTFIHVAKLLDLELK
jgi:transcriptional regulator with XRE-family HTH domain